MEDEISQLLLFIHKAEHLKFVLRHGWTSSGRQESVADHSWRVVLMVILCHKFYGDPIDLQKTLQMAIIHDLPEVITGDVPFFEALEGSLEKQKKHLLEDEVMKSLCSSLPQQIGSEMYSLWQECQLGKSKEAKFLKALDQIEAQIQQNEADIATWNEFEKKSIFTYLDKFCDHNPFLRKLKEAVQQDSINKLKTEGATNNTESIPNHSSSYSP
jgi:putative hydrolase of HD superfamily